MSQQSSPLDETTFNAILASSVHDMKNSLGLLMNSLEEMAMEITEGDTDKLEQFSYLQQQATRVNNDLMSLLSLYKIDHNQYPFNSSEHGVEEFLEDQMLRYSIIAERKGITIEIDADPMLWWNFDEGLMAGVVNDVLGNAIRYAKSKIILAADKDGAALRLTIEDDGDGYPENIMRQGAEAKKGISFQSGSTGLGLFFTSIVAQMHAKGDDKGFVELDNNSRLGGGRYSIVIP